MGLGRVLDWCGVGEVGEGALFGAGVVEVVD